MKLCLAALLGHWRRHPLQGTGILVGLWLATTLWSGVQALNQQARNDYARAQALLAGSAQAQLLPRQGEYIDQALYIELRRAGWPVSPVLEGRLRLGDSEPVSVRVLGIEPLTLPAKTRIAGYTASDLDIGAFIGPPGQAWLAPDTLQRLTASGALQQLPPPRALADLAPGVILVDIGQAQQLLHTPGKLSRLLLPAGFVKTLPDDLSHPLQLQPASDGDDLQRLTASFHLNLTALGMLAFLVGLFIVHAAIGLALEQRRDLLRTLRACGVSLRGLIAALAVELGLFATLAGLAGVACGYMLASLLLGDLAASLRGLYGAQVASHLNLEPQWWLGGLGISLLGAGLAGGASLWRAARLPVLAIAQPQAWRTAQARSLRRQSALALVAALVAAGCWQYGAGLIAAFSLMAAMLLAAALLLPALLDGLLALLTRYCRRPLSQWFVADSRQQLPSLALALMALLLALAASVGVSSMTSGFQRTFLGWLDQRLAAQLYITPQDTPQALALGAWLAEQPTVAAVVPTWQVDVRPGGFPALAQGFVEHPGYREHWPLLEQRSDAWEQLAAGAGVMLSEQLARRLKLGLGDTLQLGGQPLQVVALYADYGNPRGHLLVEAQWLRRTWPQARLSGLNVYLPADQVASLSARIEARQPFEGARLTDQGTLKRWSLGVFQRTFAATTALNGLTLGVAGVALFISLLTLGQARLGQLAPLRALGVPRGWLTWLALGQTLMLASLTVLLAMPLGILLAWCLVAVVNVEAFGWRLPLQVFPGQLLRLGLLGLATSLLAAAWPLWQLARRQPAELLRRLGA